VAFKKINGNTYNEFAVVASPDEPLPVASSAVPGLSIPEHDHIALSYTGTDLTGIVYRKGGAGGTVVATLTLAYDGSGNLSTVTRS